MKLGSYQAPLFLFLIQYENFEQEVLSLIDKKTILSSINPLYDANKETRQEYGAWSEPSRRLRIRAVAVLTGILYIVYAQIEMLLPAPFLEFTTLLHLYILPASLFFISLLTLSHRFYRPMIYLLMLAPVGAAIVNLLLLGELGEYAIYFPELLLIIIWIFAVSGLGLLHAVISATSIILLLLFMQYYYLPLVPQKLFLMYCFWFSSAYLFGLVTAFLLEKSNKTIFLNTLSLEHLASTDMLTGHFNRTKIEDLLRSEIERAERYGTFFSVILMDIDHFKKVNDEYGHPIGDIILQEFSLLLNETLRKADSVGRWGGEEFLIILPETDAEGAKEVAEHLRKRIEKFEFTAVKHKTSSFGITQYQKGSDIQSLVNKADVALYNAKNKGRNQVSVTL